MGGGWVCFGVGLGVKDWDSLLLDTSWASFMGRQPVLQASFQPHGHIGGLVADCERVQGLQGGAVPVQGVGGDCGRVWVV